MQKTEATALMPSIEEAWPDAFRIAWVILRNRSDAEDAAQDACARALHAAGTLRDPLAFKSWFYRIVVNEARRRLRKRPFEPIDDRPIDFNAPDDRIDVRTAIERLDPLDRVAIALFYYADLSTAEIATAIHATPLAVRLRLMNARRRLRRLLQPTIASLTQGA